MCKFFFFFFLFFFFFFLFQEGSGACQHPDLSICIWSLTYLTLYIGAGKKTSITFDRNNIFR